MYLKWLAGKYDSPQFSVIIHDYKIYVNLINLVTLTEKEVIHIWKQDSLLNTEKY